MPTLADLLANPSVHSAVTQVTEVPRSNDCDRYAVAVSPVSTVEPAATKRCKRRDASGTTAMAATLLWLPLSGSVTTHAPKPTLQVRTLPSFKPGCHAAVGYRGYRYAEHTARVTAQYRGR
jgi:hypothetical protein